MASDMAEIHQLYARYAWLLDEGRYDEWINCFTEDAKLSGPLSGQLQGRQDMVRFITRYKAENRAVKIRHVITNILVEIDGDRATGRCYSLFYRTQRGRTELCSIGGYDDRLRQVDGRWLFESRQAFVDHSGSAI